MKSTSPQDFDEHADRPRSTVGNASQQSPRRPSQPKFVLQPVVLDDAAAPNIDDQCVESGSIKREAGPEVAAERHQRTPVVAPNVSRNVRAWRGSQESIDQTRAALLERRVPLLERPAIIGVLVVCCLIAIALFVTLLLNRMPLVA